ncbi:putative ring-h2 finger protein atl21a [Quercus suber]|uniref:RING-type E3 ubiquitin transferase n=1 Tax=Quercus suber TaxID=58331 RepID=A0AAW0JJG1_QUESU
MASFQSFFISTFFFFLLQAQHQAQKIANLHIAMFINDKCSQDKCCGYLGFSLSCNNQRQTILTLPYSGDFLVLEINYWNRVMIIDDPDSCLPRRFLNQHFTLMDSPFHLLDINVNIALFNCSNDPIYDYGQYPCLSGDNFTFS